MGRFFAALVLIFWAPMALAQDSYRIQPGDLLQIEVLEDASLNRQVLVLPDGRFAFPNAGTQRAGGRTIGQVRNGLVGALTPLFAAPPTVYVNIAALAAPDEPVGELPEETIDIYVVGEVTNPGKRAVEPGTTMLQFLAEMGGFSKFAATKRIQLRRNEKGGTQRVVNFNYRAIERGTVQARHIHLREGDVIVVPTRRLFE